MNIDEAVRLVRELEQSNALYESNMKANSDRIKSLKESIIPDMLRSQNVKAMTLSDGTKIRIDPLICATATDAAFAWMEEHGFGDMIKKKVEAPLDAVPVLEEAGIDFAVKRTIHYQTLKAFVREQLEAGNVVPAEAFQLYIGATTYIKNS